MVQNEPLAWDDLRLLLAVHRSASLLAAGRALKLSTSTVARRLERLEAAVGRPLLLRTSAGTRLEPSARDLVALAEQLELGLAAAGRGSAGLSGVVRISTGDGFARPLTPVLAAVRRAHPGLQIELVAETRTADVARGEADLGVRTARTSSAVLVERALGSLSFGLYASQRFVEERLRTLELTAEDAPRLDFVGYTRELEAFPQQRWLESLGATHFVFRSNNDAVLLDAARAGQGIAALADLAAGVERDLVRLATARPGPRVPVWLVFHREARKAPRIRAVVDAIANAFEAGLGR
jgi:DNA-binding transcriptional LysR family regulator